MENPFEFATKSGESGATGAEQQLLLSANEDTVSQMLDPLPMLPLEQAALLLNNPQTILSPSHPSGDDGGAWTGSPSDDSAVGAAGLGSGLAGDMVAVGSKRKYSISSTASSSMTDEEFALRNEIRLQNNRMSAKMSRERKKRFVANLEQEVNRLREACLHLEAMKRVLWKQNEELQTDLTQQTVHHAQQQAQAQAQAQAQQHQQQQSAAALQLMNTAHFQDLFNLIGVGSGRFGA